MNPENLDPSGAALAKAIEQRKQLLVLARFEREEAQAQGLDTQWLDTLITGLEDTEQDWHDREVLHAIRLVVLQHGSGP